MKTQIISSSLPGHRACFHLNSLLPSIAGIFLALVHLLVACEKSEFVPDPTGQFGSEEAIVEEISFLSEEFTIVGDLRTPVEGEKHPVVLMIHGSGEATRNGAVPFTPMIEIFLRHGYAVFSWDKPGSGASKGTMDPEYILTQRSRIIREAIEVLSDYPSVDVTEVGLWGISQAGWVMPMALELSQKISWMMVVSGGGEDGIEQGAFQVGQRIACNGGSEEDVATVEEYWAIMNKALSYEEYKNAAQILLDIPGLYESTGLIISDKEQWSPWKRYINAFFDPVDVLRRTTIPVLAFFGERDKYVDPVQGAHAYDAALDEAGNQEYRIETITGAGHIMVQVETGCPGEAVGTEYMIEYMDILELWLMDR